MRMSFVSARYMQGLPCSFWKWNSENSPDVSFSMKNTSAYFSCKYDHRFKSGPIQINGVIRKIVADIFSIVSYVVNATVK